MQGHAAVVVQYPSPSFSTNAVPREEGGASGGGECR